MADKTTHFQIWAPQPAVTVRFAFAWGGREPRDNPRWLATHDLIRNAAKRAQAEFRKRNKIVPTPSAVWVRSYPIGADIGRGVADQIRERARAADVFVADLSEPNQNVILEIGWFEGATGQYALITQDTPVARSIPHLPSDLQGRVVAMLHGVNSKSTKAARTAALTQTELETALAREIRRALQRRFDAGRAPATP